MKTLIVTNMYPNKNLSYYGMVVKEEVDCLEKLKVDTKVFFINGRENRLNYFYALPDLARLLSNNEYDVIHCHHTYCGILAIFALRLIRKKIPLVMSLHEGEIFHNGKIDYEIDLIKRIKYIKFIKNFAIQRTNFIITVNKNLVNGLPEEKYSVIPNGVNLGLFKPLSRQECRKRLNIPNNAKMLFFPSDNTRPEKRFDIAQKAHTILKNGYNYNVVLVSGNSIDYELMPVYYNASDCCLLTSDYEASPMVIKEAMAVNMPIVSVDVGDVRHMIGNLEGCFIASKEPQDIAQKIRKALDFSGKVKTRDRIIELELSQEQAAAKIIKIYEKQFSKN